MTRYLRIPTFETASFKFCSSKIIPGSLVDRRDQKGLQTFVPNTGQPLPMPIIKIIATYKAFGMGGGSPCAYECIPLK